MSIYDKYILVAERLSALGFAGGQATSKAMLIQETGLQRELTRDEIARRTPEQEAMLFERKVALSFVGRIPVRLSGFGIPIRT